MHIGLFAGLVVAGVAVGWTLCGLYFFFFLPWDSPGRSGEECGFCGKDPCRCDDLYEQDRERRERGLNDY